MYLLILLLVILLLYLIAIHPAKNDKINEFVGHRYAHRGLHDDKIPENSLAAFRRARDRGFGIELDVRLSKDGKLVVFHDETLERMVGIHGSTTDYTAVELAGMSLKGTEEGIPQLKEVLKLVNGKVPLLIEIKELSKEKEVAPALAMMMRSYEGPYIVESFNPTSLSRFRKVLPHVPRGILSQSYHKYPEFQSETFLALEFLLLNFIGRPCFVAFRKNHIKHNISFHLCRLMGASTMAWTVLSEEDEKMAFKAGFDTVIFEGYIPGEEKAEEKSEEAPEE